MNNEVSDGWTRAALVVSGVARRGGDVLMVREPTRSADEPDRWVLPGGRVEPGELLDAAVKREVLEETGLRVKTIGSLALGSQQYVPQHAQPVLWLAFNVALESSEDADLVPNDPDGIVAEARFVPIAEAIDLLLSGEFSPGAVSAAQSLSRPPDAPPTIWLWDLTKSPDRPVAQIPMA